MDMLTIHIFCNITKYITLKLQVTRLELTEDPSLLNLAGFRAQNNSVYHNLILVLSINSPQQLSLVGAIHGVA